jgi:hypothetical protein
MKDGRFIRGDVLWELLDKQAAEPPDDEPSAAHSEPLAATP